MKISARTGLDPASSTWWDFNNYEIIMKYLLSANLYYIKVLGALYQKKKKKLEEKG